jgi:ribokinase
MYDIISIGGATLDVFLHCPDLQQGEIDGQKKIVFPYGQKTEVGSVLFEIGGGATNTSTTFARLGLKTAIIAKIGKDFSGERIIKKLKEEAISTEFIIEDPEDSTDFSTILWKEKEGSVLLVSRGKGHLEVTDEQWKNIQTKWFYISSVEGNLDIVKKVIELSKANGAKIAWNPGKMELSQKDTVKELLPTIELLIVNRKESAILTDQDGNDTDMVLKAVKDLSAKTKLVTDGHNGSYFYNGTNWTWSESFTVEKRETTGAGDAYGSAFVAAVIQDLPEHDRFKLAAANAASVVMHTGAKQGILKKEELDSWIQKDLQVKNI